jgi:uncharacterized protein YecT (DUF1311 family)
MLTGKLLEQAHLIEVVYGKTVTPLLIAAKSGNEDIASALLARGANPNRSFHHGLEASPLAATVFPATDLSMSRLLLTHGALPATVGSFQFDQLIERQQQEEIALLLEFGLERIDVGHRDGNAMQNGELNRVNADAVEMILRSNPTLKKTTCHETSPKKLTESCLPGELRGTDAAIQKGYSRVLEKASDKNHASLVQQQLEWAQKLRKTCHTPPRTDIPDGWYAAVLDDQSKAVCVISMLRQQEDQLERVMN